MRREGIPRQKITSNRLTPQASKCRTEFGAVGPIDHGSLRDWWRKVGGETSFAPLKGSTGRNPIEIWVRNARNTASTTSVRAGGSLPFPDPSALFWPTFSKRYSPALFPVSVPTLGCHPRSGKAAHQEMALYIGLTSVWVVNGYRPGEALVTVLPFQTASGSMRPPGR